MKKLLLGLALALSVSVVCAQTSAVTENIDDVSSVYASSNYDYRAQVSFTFRSENGSETQEVSYIDFSVRVENSQTEVRFKVVGGYYLGVEDRIPIPGVFRTPLIALIMAADIACDVLGASECHVSNLQTL